MQIEVIQSALDGFQQRQILRVEMRIMVWPISGQEKRKIRMVGVEQVEPSFVKCMIAGNNREPGIQ